MASSGQNTKGKAHTMATNDLEGTARALWPLRSFPAGVPQWQIARDAGRIRPFWPLWPDTYQRAQRSLGKTLFAHSVLLARACQTSSTMREASE